MRDFQLPGRSEAIAANGMCATSHPLAAITAIDVLRDEGNAVDAAIAAAMVLNVCEPHMTGLGGDCFVLLKPAGSEEIIGLNGSGRAPDALDAGALRAEGYAAMPEKGAISVSLPGAVDAFCRLSQDWGRLDLARQLAPAIRYAEEGVPVAPRTALDWNNAADRLSGIARERYLIEGKAPRAGQVFRAPYQAGVLRQIASRGRAGFYEGEVAEDLIRSLQARGGSHEMADLAATRCEYTRPISTAYRHVEVVEHPPNGQGAAALLILDILSRFDLAGLDPLGAERAHIEAEAVKLAYDARDRLLADPDSTTRLEHMLSARTAERLAELIDLRRAAEAPAKLAEHVHRDTVLLTVVDRDRMAVSMIYSLYSSFGSGLASESFGILFQNRAAGFNLIPDHPNEAGGGKRPLHTIIPGMIREQGKVVMPFGVMGGAYQAAGHARFAGNLADYGMDIQSAMDAPRCFADNVMLMVERGYSAETRDALAALGHRVEESETPIGGAQAILIDEANGVLRGGSDPRKDGCALGY